MSRLLIRWWAGCLAVVAVTVSLPVGEVGAAPGDPSQLTDSSTLIETVNHYRAASGLGPVVDNAGGQAGAVTHSCYMLRNQELTHTERPGASGFTVVGRQAGENGNVAMSSAVQTDRFFGELWLSGPYHALGLLRPGLRSVGVGRCDNETFPLWRSALTADLTDTDWSRQQVAAPVMFPGDGSTVSMNRFITEVPNPLAGCGWSTAGLPLIVSMPEPSLTAAASLTNSAGRPVETCVLTAGNDPNASGRAILGAANAVVVIPKDTLPDDRFTVSVSTETRNVSWSFTVDAVAGPTAEDVVVADAVLTGTKSGLVPVNPSRVVDTRAGVGGRRLAAGVEQRFQITGGAVPAGSAVALNVTVVGANADGWVSLWPCGPWTGSSTVNFGADDVVANHTIVPVDSRGGVCVKGSASVEVVVDVTGVFTTGKGAMFTALNPVRVADTRNSSPVRRPGPGEVVALNVAPAGVVAVKLSVTAVAPTVGTYVTVWPCDRPRPLASSVNVDAGAVRSNQVLVQVGAGGLVCFSSPTSVDLVVDKVGEFSAGGRAWFQPVVPFRLKDTRFAKQVELGVGFPDRLPGNIQVGVNMAGTRGLPAGSVAVESNVVVVDPVAAGWFSAWECGKPQPTVSMLNHGVGELVSNSGTLPLGRTGSFAGVACFRSLVETDLVIDVTGVWVY